MKDKKLKIGQEVFEINRNLSITRKTILAFITNDKEITYKIDFNSCGGVSQSSFFLSKHKAEVVKQNFLDGLKFKVGDLLIFKHKEYSSTINVIGQVTEITYDGNPYTIKTANQSVYNITDDAIVLKIKNKYIENFGKIKELNKEFKDKQKEMNNITLAISDEHDLLEKDLMTTFRKQTSIFNIRKRPLFKNRYNYTGGEYD